MKIKDYNCKCGHDNFFFANKGNQKGIYCSYCGKWLKWADKDEQNLSMKQESVLDKIRAEIDELYSYVEFDEDIKTSFNMVRLEEVQRVINKYRTESEVEDV